MNETYNSQLSGRLILENTSINIFGQIAIMVAALISVPLILRILNTERFGILNLIWVIINYFTIFDFGLGRALTQAISGKISTGCIDEIPTIIWTSLGLLNITGIILFIASFFFMPILVTQILSIPPGYQKETIHAFNILAVSIPIIICSAALRGILEAMQRFKLINYVRIPSGIFTLASPLLVLPFSKKLESISIMLVLGQFISSFGYIFICFRIIPGFKKIVFRFSKIKPLLMVGGWMTISNVISPLMVYIDRFFIGAIVSIAAVSYYSIPFEVVTKLWLFSGAFMRVLFPSFSVGYIINRERTTRIFDWGLKLIWISLFPIVLLLVIFAKEGLTLWIGFSIAQKSKWILQILAIGVLTNCIAQIPFSFIQASGRPDITGKINLIELPIYIFILWESIKLFGVIGAAIAWDIRIFIDSLFLFYYAQKITVELRSKIKIFIIQYSLSIVVILICIQINNIINKIIFIIIIISLFYLYAWNKIVDLNQRNQIVEWIKSKLLFFKIIK